jgi:hypothetical protein
MRRFLVPALLVAAVLVGLVAVYRAPGTGAQDATPAMASHPIVGTWLVKDLDDPSSPPFQNSFTADGVIVQADPQNGTSLGVWRPTGERTVEVTFQQVAKDGIATIRGEGEVATDGQTFDATYTIEFAPTGGKATGQYGPGHVHGTRLSVEPMGTPVGPISALFAQFGGTPEATPAP